MMSLEETQNLPQSWRQQQKSANPNLQIIFSSTQQDFPSL